MKEVKVTFDSGLDSRDIALFVQTANKFSSKIQIAVDTAKVNAKSIMGVISLAIKPEQVVSIIAEGEDEESAISELVNFL